MIRQIGLKYGNLLAITSSPANFEFADTFSTKIAHEAYKKTNFPNYNIHSNENNNLDNNYYSMTIMHNSIVNMTNVFQYNIISPYSNSCKLSSIKSIYEK